MSESTSPALTRKDFVSNQDVRWCPGCGDYAILAAVQKLMPELGIPKERIVWVSGIGCSSRFPYYMNTYGFHTIHGRAPAVAMGIRVANPDLSVWIATGDGDSLSIGGNHLLHCLRRNLDVNILLFNNRIYGLTKGQYSPTSDLGSVTKSTPHGSVDDPLDPSTFALGCGGTFIARAIDTDARLLHDVLKRGASHRGTSLIEIYQNCVVFNDGVFDGFSAPAQRKAMTVVCEHGKPLLFGEAGEFGLHLDPSTLTLQRLELGKDGHTLHDVLIHDETNPILGTLLSRMRHPGMPVALGVIHASSRPTYESRLADQRTQATQRQTKVSLDALLRAGNVWEVK
jgi:2-oxoglutarate ferredoxin oxidoreductase subunit beta